MTNTCLAVGHFLDYFVNAGIPYGYILGAKEQRKL